MEQNLYHIKCDIDNSIAAHTHNFHIYASSEEDAIKNLRNWFDMFKDKNEELLISTIQITELDLDDVVVWQDYI